MIHGIILAILLVSLGFGAGRVRHPANLKLAAVKARLAQLESAAVSDAKYIIAEIRAKL